MSGQDPNERRTRAQRDSDLADRLAKLNARIDTGKASRKAQQDREEERNNKGDRAGIALAFRLSSEFIAAIVVGAVFGFGIDQFFGSTPWGMIVFLLLGFAAGVLNALRSAGMVAESGLHLKKLQDEDGESDKNR